MTTHEKVKPDWDKAKKHLDRMFKAVQEIGFPGLFMGGQIAAYQGLFDAGDRSTALYLAIMELH